MQKAEPAVGQLRKACCARSKLGKLPSCEQGLLGACTGALACPGMAGAKLPAWLGAHSSGALCSCAGCGKEALGMLAACLAAHCLLGACAAALACQAAGAGLAVAAAKLQASRPLARQAYY